MKKLILPFILTATFVAAVTFAGCGKNNKVATFGVFGQNGYYLTAFAKKDITADQARQMVKGSASLSSDEVMTLSYIKDAPPEVSGGDLAIVRTNYAGFKMETRFFKDDSSEMQSESSIHDGQVFANYLQQNSIPSSAGLVVKNLIVTADTIDYMLEQNAKFASDPDYINAPFRTLYSFHLDSYGRLVIQMRDYTEIPASVTGGGINCTYRQDTEAVYDAENKLIMWQTSLGVKVATAGDTLTQGYVYEVEFTWTQKDG